jgi:hypothetical protein
VDRWFSGGGFLGIAARDELGSLNHVELTFATVLLLIETSLLYTIFVDINKPAAEHPPWRKEATD